MIIMELQQKILRTLQFETLILISLKQEAGASASAFLLLKIERRTPYEP